MDETLRIDDSQNDSLNESTCAKLAQTDEKSNYCLTSKSDGSELQLKYGINKIGRSSEECDLVIQNQSLSKLHAIIEIQRSGCFISDNNSSNKTRKNGLALKENVLYEIKENDLLQFGTEQFEFMLKTRESTADVNDYSIKNTLEMDDLVGEEEQLVEKETLENNDKVEKTVGKAQEATSDITETIAETLLVESTQEMKEEIDTQPVIQSTLEEEKPIVELADDIPEQKEVQNDTKSNIVEISASEAKDIEQKNDNPSVDEPKIEGEVSEKAEEISKEKDEEHSDEAVPESFKESVDTRVEMEEVKVEEKSIKEEAPLERTKVEEEAEEKSIEETEKKCEKDTQILEETEKHDEKGTQLLEEIEQESTKILEPLGDIKSKEDNKNVDEAGEKQETKTPAKRSRGTKKPTSNEATPQTETKRPTRQSTRLSAIKSDSTEPVPTPSKRTTRRKESQESYNEEQSEEPVAKKASTRGKRLDSKKEEIIEEKEAEKTQECEEKDTHSSIAKERPKRGAAQKKSLNEEEEEEEEEEKEEEKEKEVKKALAKRGQARKSVYQAFKSENNEKENTDEKEPQTSTSGRTLRTRASALKKETLEVKASPSKTPSKRKTATKASVYDEGEFDEEDQPKRTRRGRALSAKKVSDDDECTKSPAKQTRGKGASNAKNDETKTPATSNTNVFFRNSRLPKSAAKSSTKSDDITETSDVNKSQSNGDGSPRKKIKLRKVNDASSDDEDENYDQSSDNEALNNSKEKSKAID